MYITTKVILFCKRVKNIKTNIKKPWLILTQVNTRALKKGAAEGRRHGFRGCGVTH